MKALKVILTGILLVGLLFGLPGVVHADEWQELHPDTAPDARCGHSMVTIDNDIYLFGGLVESSPELVAQNPPPDRSLHSMNTLPDGRMVVVSSVRRVGEVYQALSDVDLRPAEQHLDTGCRLPRLLLRCEHRSGGEQGVQDSWETVTVSGPAPSPRLLAASAQSATKARMFCGVDADTSAYLNGLLRFSRQMPHHLKGA